MKKISTNKYYELLGLMTLAQKHNTMLHQINQTMAAHLTENVEGLEINSTEDWVNDIVFGNSADTEAFKNTEQLLEQLGIEIEM